MNEQLFELIKQRFESVEKQITGLDSKVDELLSFKWQIIGGSVLMSVILSIVVTLVSK
jgi:hypothetical protein